MSWQGIQQYQQLIRPLEEGSDRSAIDLEFRLEASRARQVGIAEMKNLRVSYSSNSASRIKFLVEISVRNRATGEFMRIKSNHLEILAASLYHCNRKMYGDLRENLHFDIRYKRVLHMITKPWIARPC